MQDCRPTCQTGFRLHVYPKASRNIGWRRDERLRWQFYQSRRHYDQAGFRQRAHVAAWSSDLHLTAVNEHEASDAPAIHAWRLSSRILPVWILCQRVYQVRAYCRILHWKYSRCHIHPRNVGNNMEFKLRSWFYCRQCVLASHAN